MTTTARSMSSTTGQSRIKGYPVGGLRFDWLFAFLACLLIAGLMIDGWAHFHGQVDDSFFTPWHFLFYSAFGTVALFLAFNQYRNVNKGHAWGKALPVGYWLSLIGAVIFALGGVGDMIWHTLFGIEQGTEALLSPSHLMLAIGMGLIVTGPLRAAWFRAESRGWFALGPAIIGAILLLFLLGFFSSYVHPLVTPMAANFGGESTNVTQSDALYVMNSDGTGQTRLTNTPEFASSSASWSPDGTQIVYAQGVTEEEYDLYSMGADGTQAVQLTDLPGREFNARWSPDGSKIAFIHENDVYLMNPDGSEITRITETPLEEWFLAWSPDSSQLAVGVNDSGHYYTDLMNADGSNRHTFPIDLQNGTATWSPDGTKLVYGASENNTNFDLYTANLDGSDITRLTVDSAFDGFPVWSSDGTQIIFSSWRSGNSEVYAMPVSGDEDAVVNLSKNPALVNSQPIISADGSKILMVGRGQSVDNDADFSTQNFGVTAMLLQAAFMVGIMVLLVRRWQLPIGVFTVMFTAYTLMITTLTDLYLFVPAAFAAGVIVDVLVWRLKPSGENLNNYRMFAFLAPMLYFGLNLLTVQLMIGVGWNIHVWAGAIFLTGLMGLLISILPTVSERPALS